MIDKNCIDGQFITIQSWMCTRLGLKGNELLIYALIYGFSQDGCSVFSGSLSYISKWTGTSKKTVMSSLKNLVEKGLIEKIEKNINGVCLIDYKTSIVWKNFPWGMEEISMGGMEKITPHNINKDNIEDIKEKDKKEKSTSMKKFNVTISDLIKLGVSEEVAERWITYRKSKKSSYTKRVIESYIKQAKTLNVSLESVLTIQMEKGWTGFDAEWVKRSNFQSGYVDEFGVRRVAPTIYTREHTNEQRRKNGF